MASPAVLQCAIDALIGAGGEPVQMRFCLGLSTAEQLDDGALLGVRDVALPLPNGVSGRELQQQADGFAAPGLQFTYHDTLHALILSCTTMEERQTMLGPYSLYLEHNIAQKGNGLGELIYLQFRDMATLPYMYRIADYQFLGERPVVSSSVGYLDSGLKLRPFMLQSEMLRMYWQQVLTASLMIYMEQLVASGKSREEVNALIDESLKEVQSSLLADIPGYQEPSIGGSNYIGMRLSDPLSETKQLFSIGLAERTAQDADLYGAFERVIADNQKNGLTLFPVFGPEKMDWIKQGAYALAGFDAPRRHPG